MVKVCPRCKAALPREAFGRASNRSDGLQWECRSCRSAHVNKSDRALYMKAYCEKNGDALKAKAAQRYRDNPEPIRAKSRKWRRENPEKARLRDREYYRRNADRRRVSNREYERTHRTEAKKRHSAWLARSGNRDRKNAHCRKWNAANPEKLTEASARRRARLASAGKVEKIDRREIFDRDGGICHLCRLPVEFIAFELDHVIPVSRGGAHVADNLKVAHRSCNAKKGARL